MDQKRSLYWAREVNKWHWVIIFLDLIAITALFTSYNVYGAIYIVVLYLIYAFYRQNCPLTELEHELLDSAGKYDKTKKYFVVGWIKRHLKINIPIWLGRVFVFILFIISLYIILNNLSIV